MFVNRYKPRIANDPDLPPRKPLSNTLIHGGTERIDESYGWFFILFFFFFLCSVFFFSSCTFSWRDRTHRRVLWCVFYLVCFFSVLLCSFFSSSTFLWRDDESYGLFLSLFFSLLFSFFPFFSSTLYKILKKPEHIDESYGLFYLLFFFSVLFCSFFLLLFFYLA